LRSSRCSCLASVAPMVRPITGEQARSTIHSSQLGLQSIIRNIVKQT